MQVRLPSGSFAAVPDAGSVSTSRTGLVCRQKACLHVNLVLVFVPISGWNPIAAFFVGNHGPMHPRYSPGTHAGLVCRLKGVALYIDLVIAFAPDK
jgi:hypothetical protein